MNHPYGYTVNAAGKKDIRSSAALALVVGLVLAFSGAAAWAAWAAPGDPIPGTEVGLEGDPEPIKFSDKTRPDGTYKFTGLAPGKYKLSVDRQPVQTITVGAKGSITGVLSEGPDGKAAITFNGQAGLVDIPTAPVNTSRSNKKTARQGIVAEKEQTGLVDIPTAPVNTSRSNKKAGRVAENESPRPTSRGINVAAGDVNGDGVDAASSARLGLDNDNRTATPKPTRSGELTDGLLIIRYGTAPAPKGGGWNTPGHSGRSRPRHFCWP